MARSRRAAPEGTMRSAGARAKALPLLALVWLLFLAVQTHLRNRDWQTAETLFGGDLALATESFLVPHNYGVVVLREGRIEEAKELFELAIARAPGPGYGTAHNSLGSVLEQLGDAEGADREFARSIALSRYPLAFSNRARVLLGMGRVEEARRVLEDGLRSYPYQPNLYYYLGYVFAAEERWPEAIEAWERVPIGSPGLSDVSALLTEARRRLRASRP